MAYTRDNTWAIGYHGMADAFPRRFQVLFDGRSIYSPACGAVNGGELRLSIDDIERIEVVHGPKAATCGANAFLAVMNNAGSPGRFTNRVDFTVRGGDLQLNWQPFTALRLSAQYARAFIDADRSVDRDLTQSTPRNNFSLLARYALRRVGLAVRACIARAHEMAV